MSMINSSTKFLNVESEYPIFLPADIGGNFGLGVFLPCIVTLDVFVLNLLLIMSQSFVIYQWSTFWK